MIIYIFYRIRHLELPTRNNILRNLWTIYYIPIWRPSQLFNMVLVVLPNQVFRGNQSWVDRGCQLRNIRFSFFSNICLYFSMFMLICNMYALFVKKYGKVLKIEKNQFLSTKLDNQILDLYPSVNDLLKNFCSKKYYLCSLLLFWKHNGERNLSNR